MVTETLARKKGRYQAARTAFPRRKIGAAVLAAIALTTVLLFRLGLSENREVEEPQVTVQKLENASAIPGFESLTLQAGTKKQKIVLSNPAENTCLFQISLLLEDGTLLWVSELIEPGEDSDPIRLSKTLSAGQYPNACLKYECFAMDADKTPLNGAEIKLTLRVKE